MKILIWSISATANHIPDDFLSTPKFDLNEPDLLPLLVIVYGSHMVVQGDSAIYKLHAPRGQSPPEVMFTINLMMYWWESAYWHKIANGITLKCGWIEPFLAADDNTNERLLIFVTDDYVALTQWSVYFWLYIMYTILMGYQQP